MMQVITIPETEPRPLTLSAPEKFSDEEYYAFCRANPELRVERTADGEIRIVPPAGGESSYRSGKTYSQLDRWAEMDSTGKALESSVQFLLPDGAGLSPDAAWVSNERLNALPKPERKKFLRLVPEFVIEVRSPSDRLTELKAKMDQWIRNGVQLAWLIDGDAETIYVYRRGRAPRVHRKITQLAGEGPVKGFVLQLSIIWEGL